MKSVFSLWKSNVQFFNSAFINLSNSGTFGRNTVHDDGKSPRDALYFRWVLPFRIQWSRCKQLLTFAEELPGQTWNVRFSICWCITVTTRADMSAFFGLSDRGKLVKLLCVLLERCTEQAETPYLRQLREDLQILVNKQSKATIRICVLEAMSKLTASGTHFKLWKCSIPQIRWIVVNC